MSNVTVNPLHAELKITLSGLGMELVHFEDNDDGSILVDVFEPGLIGPMVSQLACATVLLLPKHPKLKLHGYFNGAAMPIEIPENMVSVLVDGYVKGDNSQRERAEQHFALAWSIFWDKHCEEMANDPEVRHRSLETARKLEEKRDAYQKNVDDFQSQDTDAFSKLDLEGRLRAIRDLMVSIDLVGVEVNHARIRAIIEAAGYEQNRHVLIEGEVPQYGLYTLPYTTEYLMGQVLDLLPRGHGFPPGLIELANLCIKWCEAARTPEYKRLDEFGLTFQLRNPNIARGFSGVFMVAEDPHYDGSTTREQGYGIVGNEPADLINEAIRHHEELAKSRQS